MISITCHTVMSYYIMLCKIKSFHIKNVYIKVTSLIPTPVKIRVGNDLQQPMLVVSRL